MLKFLTKEFVWERMDEGLHRQLGWNTSQIHLKTWQDLAVYHYLRGKTGLRGACMSLSLLALYGIATYLALGLFV